MPNRHELPDGQLEQLLQSLPEVEPPTDLTARIMSRIDAEAADVEAVGNVASRAAASTAWSAVSLRRLAAGLVASATLAAPLLVYYWPLLVQFVTDGARFVGQSVAAATGATASVAGAVAVFVAKLGTVWLAADKIVRTVVDVVFAELGWLMAAMLGVTVVLQTVLWVIMRQRDDLA